MNKTFYLKDEEAAVWDRARELANDKLSPVIVAALRSYVAEQEAQIKQMDRIVIRYNDKATDDRPTAKGFYGKWLITPEDPYCPTVKNSLGITMAAPRPPLKEVSLIGLDQKLDLSNFDFSKVDFTNFEGLAKTQHQPTPAGMARYRRAEKRQYGSLAEAANTAIAPLDGSLAEAVKAGIAAMNNTASEANAAITPLRSVGLRKSYAVAVSAKGSVVLFGFEGNPELPSGTLWIYSSFEEAFEKNTGDSRPALNEALLRQGVPIQELDI